MVAELTISYPRFAVVSCPRLPRGHTQEGLAMARIGNRSAGMLLLAIWLILHGLTGLIGFTFTGLGVLMAILALVAGLLLLLGR